MRRYQGSVSDSYLASLVPTSFAVDLQAHLAWVVRRMEDKYGLRSTQIPDLYLMADRKSLETVAEATKGSVGFEHGYYRSHGDRPGIYMRADQFRTGIQRLLTHEYVHLMVDELSGGSEVPAWVNEGLADYVEYQLGLEAERPSATRLLLYLQVDRVKQAQSLGNAPSLVRLEDQATWNSQTSEAVIDLQYGKAYMAVRYISEEFSEDAPIEIIRLVGDGLSLPGAIQQTLGISYMELRRQVDAWIAQWTDPDREDVRTYVDLMNDVYDQLDKQIERRNDELGNNQSLSQRAHVLRDVVNEIEDIEDQVLDIPFPEPQRDIHDAFRVYVETGLEWLTLERDYAQTGRDKNRTDANAMLPEVNARSSEVWRAFNNLQYIYQVGRY